MCQWYTGTRIVCNLIPPGGLHQHVPISPRSAVGVRRPASRGACGNRRTVHLNVRRLEEFRREAASRGEVFRREAFPRVGSREAASRGGGVRRGGVLRGGGRGGGGGAA